MKSKLKPPGTGRLKANCDIVVSPSAFKFNLRRYIMGSTRGQGRNARVAVAEVVAAVVGWAGAAGAAGGAAEGAEAAVTAAAAAGAYTRLLFSST